MENQNLFTTVTKIFLTLLLDLIIIFFLLLRIVYHLFKYRKHKNKLKFFLMFLRFLMFKVINLKNKTMGILKQGIFGGVSGKVGNLIGSSWKGIPVIKTKPLSVANPKTAKQVEQRSKFTYCVAFAQLILSAIIKPLWDRFAVQASGFNDFVSYNVEFFDAVFPSDPNSLFISRGKMPITVIDDSLIDVASHFITVTWTATPLVGTQLASDLAYLLLYNNSAGELVMSTGLVVRSAEEIQATVPDGWKVEDDIYSYLAFKRVDGTIVSNSYYKVVAAVP